MPDDEDDGPDLNEIVEALMQVNMMLEPIIEFAAGLRSKLMQQGWSESIADDVSGDVLKKMISIGMSGAGR